MEPLKFHPIFKRAIWGGDRLKNRLHKPAPDAADVAESWEISEVPGNSSIVMGGVYDGVTLTQLREQHGQQLLGRHDKATLFPLLIKFLDANRQLSVQVHPENQRDSLTNQLTYGKTECWTVLDAEPDSRMYLGLREGVDRQTFESALKSGSVESCLHFITPRAGDFIFIPAGTVHALGGGILIAEVQQTSDTTYRVHDWGRLDSAGNPRPLHVKEALSCINFEKGPVSPVPPQPITNEHLAEELVRCPYFVVQRRFGASDWILKDDNRLHILIAIQGSARIEGKEAVSISAGETVLIPADRSQQQIHINQESILLDIFLPDDVDLV